MFKVATGRPARRAALLGAAGLALVLAIAGCREHPPERPSIVFILVDDLGAVDLPSYGHPFHRAPSIDALAREGLSFTRAYAASPVCAPTRAALLTGKSPARLHLTHALPPQPQRLEPLPATDVGPVEQQLTEPQSATWLDTSEVTLAERLRERGYRTALIGKWHLGRGESGPTSQGFDVAVGGDEEAAPDSYFAPYGLSRLTGAPGEDLTTRLTDEALKFIDESKDRPFFLLLSHFAVHTPIEVPPPAIEEARARLIEAGVEIEEGSLVPAYAAMIESVDRSVGRILDKLDELDIARETLVVLTSDNGAVTESPETGQEIASNAPLRGGKGTLYEGGVRVPAIVRWPAVVGAGRESDALTTVMDWFPTLLEVAGLGAGELEPGRRSEGDELDVAGSSQPMSLVPTLAGTASSAPRDLHFFYPHYIPGYRHDPGRETWWNTPGGAIRAGSLKLVRRYDGANELYDLDADPGEVHDLAAERAEVAAQLAGDLDAWLAVEGAHLPRPNAAYDPGAFARSVEEALARLGRSSEWTPNGGCERVEKAGVLTIDCTTHPFVIGPEMIAEGPLRVAVRCRTTGTTGGGSIWYRAPDKPVFDGGRVALPACGTSWSVAEAVVERAGTVRQLRIDFGRSDGGRVEIDWIRLHDARKISATAPSAQWSFDEPAAGTSSEPASESR